MTISQTIKAIPPKARFMIVSAVALSVGIALFSANKLFSSNDVENKSSIASAKIDIIPKDKIDKSMPGDSQIISDESPMGMEIQKDRIEKIESAKTSRGSFVDKLELNNNKKIIADLDQQIASERPTNGLDDIMSTKAEMDRKNKADLIKRRDEIAKTASSNKPASARSQAAYFDEAAFLKDEIKSAEKSSSIDNAVSSLVSEPVGRSTQYKVASAESGSSNKTNSSQYTQSPDSPSSKYNSITSPDVSRYQKKEPMLTEYEKLVNPIAEEKSYAKEYVEAGSLHYALLETNVNSDEISPVRATIIQDGPLKGAVLIGTPVRVGEDVHITFHTMSLNKKDYSSISMVSYNTETGRAGLADEVDRHIFERYFKLAAASAVQGYASALSGVTTRTYSDGSVEKTSDALPDAGDQAAVALGAIGEKLSPVYEKEFERPPTVYVFQKPIGIMLMSGIELQ